MGTANHRANSGVTEHRALPVPIAFGSSILLGSEGFLSSEPKSFSKSDHDHACFSGSWELLLALQVFDAGRLLGSKHFKMKGLSEVKGIFTIWIKVNMVRPAVGY